VRFERGVREERRLVVDVDDPRGRSERRLDITHRAHRRAWSGSERRTLRGDRLRRLGGERALLPLHAQGVAALEGRPRRVGHDGHTRQQERRVLVAGNPHDLADAGHRSAAASSTDATRPLNTGHLAMAAYRIPGRRTSMP
jgi:hypothetical protein